jgi:hypothetical protein
LGRNKETLGHSRDIPVIKTLPDKYLFGNPVSSINSTKLRGHNSSPHYHSTSNIRHTKI